MGWNCLASLNFKEIHFHVMYCGENKLIEIEMTSYLHGKVLHCSDSTLRFCSGHVQLQPKLFWRVVQYSNKSMHGIVLY